MIDGVNTPAGIDRVLLIGVAFGGFRMENDEDLLGAPFAVYDHLRIDRSDERRKDVHFLNAAWFLVRKDRYHSPRMREQCDGRGNHDTGWWNEYRAEEADLYKTIAMWLSWRDTTSGQRVAQETITGQRLSMRLWL